MNKYQTITAESKEIVKREFKNKLTYLNPKNILSMQKFSEKLEITLKHGCILAAYQIILNKDIFMMDEESLQDVLSEMKIDAEHFFYQINMYNNYSYIIINRYIDYLLVVNNDSLSKDDKIAAVHSCFRDLNNYANMSKANISLEVDSISEERISQINDIVDEIYKETIENKITTADAKYSDLIKSAYDRKK